MFTCSYPRLRILLFILLTTSLLSSSSFSQQKDAKAEQSLDSFKPVALDYREQSIKFTKRHPLSPLKEQADRFRWKLSEEHKDYDIAEQTFQVFAPEADEVDQPMGLLVFISPSDIGRVPNEWKAALRRSNMIWVSPNQTGNEQPIWKRIGLALDAVENMKARYKIDPDRIYVAGVSGGGRVASRVGLMYGDIFKGSVSIIGTDFFKDIEVPDKPDHVWQAKFVEPNRALLQQIKTENRYVLITGENDYNQQQTREVYRQGYQQEGFKHATYLEVPDLAHEYPAGLWLDLAITALDAPILDARLMKKAQNEEVEQRADKEIANARKVLAINTDTGAKLLKRIVQTYPDTQAAADAQQLLNEIAQDKSTD